MGQALDITGKRFSKLVALRPTGESYRGKRLWLCRCDCGAEIVTTVGHLRSNHARSCGCTRKPNAIAASRRANMTHGLRSGGASTPEYRAWTAMRSRCSDPKAPNYPNYGGRGIAVCERWGSFENFLADMGPRPSAQHSLDRYPDNNGDYKPGNCRWATPVEQGRNRRTNRIIEAFGQRRPLIEWSEITGLSVDAIRDRLARGLAAEATLSRPGTSNRKAA